MNPESVVALSALTMAVTNDMFEIIIPKSYAEAMRIPQAPLWTNAMNEEMDSGESKETFVKVSRPHNPKMIPTRWVYAVKTDAMGNVQRFKGRVVVKGFKRVEGIYFK
jgi:hypothetical protein